MGFLFLLALFGAVFGSTFLDKKPDKPGFYEVQFDENGEYKYVPIKRPQKSDKEKLKASPVTAWDFRKAKDTCKAIRTVRDQKSCGGCWAFSSTDAFGAALCLNDNIDKLFSPQYMIDCPDTQTWPETSSGHSYTQAGCQGGYPIVAFQTYKKTGVVEWDCVPYTGKKNTCPSKCTNSSFSGQTINSTTSLKIKLSGSNMKLVDAYKMPLQDLRDLVTRSGPCVAEMKVYDDLSSYKQYTSITSITSFDNVYESTETGSNFEGHAITIYGFGTEGSKNYWLVKNSWGESWPMLSSGGNEGFFKIRMGLNESGIEDNFYALYDNPSDYPASKVPLPEQTTPAKYWNFEDVPNCALYPSETECKAIDGCKWQSDDDAPDDHWWNPFSARAKARRSLSSSSSSSSSISSNSSSSASLRRLMLQRRDQVSHSRSHRLSFGDDDDATTYGSSLTRLANADAADCHCRTSYNANNLCPPANRRNQTSCEDDETVNGTAVTPCYAGTDKSCGAGCLWYPKDEGGTGTCNKWDYECTDVYKDIQNGRSGYGNCATAGAYYDLQCTTKSGGGCAGVTCVDHRKNETCSAAANCKWYSYAKNYFPFCDNPSNFNECSKFDKADCLYSIAYGLTCQVVDDKCVDGGVGKCVNAAWRAGVPALVVWVVALLFMAFF